MPRLISSGEFKTGQHGGSFLRYPRKSSKPKLEYVEIELVLKLLRDMYGYDFSHYSRESIERRLNEIVQKTKCVMRGVQPDKKYILTPSFCMRQNYWILQPFMVLTSTIEPLRKRLMVFTP